MLAVSGRELASVAHLQSMVAFGEHRHAEQRWVDQPNERTVAGFDGDDSIVLAEERKRRDRNRPDRLRRVIVEDGRRGLQSSSELTRWLNKCATSRTS